MHFSSDNAEGWAPEILDALAAVQDGPAPAYGDDRWTAEVALRFEELFEREVAVFLVPTGTAANGLAFATCCPPYGAILAHEAAHAQVDECGAPEFFTGGAKMIPLAGDAGKISVEALRDGLAHAYDGFVHHAQPSVLSLTQATESGTVYGPEEITALVEIARARDMAVHLDGARFANALVHLDRSPAETTWKLGVDVLSFGATKNGCIAAEAVVFFDRERAASFAYRRKRAGHLFSKHRFLAAQMLAYLRDDLWLHLARRANGSASRLRSSLATVPGVKIWYPVEANELFVSFPEGVADQLLARGATFLPWQVPGDPAGGRMFRLVTSFATREEDVDRFATLVRELCSHTA